MVSKFKTGLFDGAKVQKNSDMRSDWKKVSLQNDRKKYHEKTFNEVFRNDFYYICTANFEILKSQIFKS